MILHALYVEIINCGSDYMYDTKIVTEYYELL